MSAIFHQPLRYVHLRRSIPLLSIAYLTHTGECGSLVFRSLHAVVIGTCGNIFVTLEDSIMKIKRQGGNDDAVTFYIRLTNISEGTKNSLLSELKNLQVELNRPKNDPTSFVVLIDLNGPSFDTSIIKNALVKYQIAEANYGLWVSVNSEFDHGGFTLPEKIAKLYRELGGSFDVSYTIS